MPISSRTTLRSASRLGSALAAFALLALPTSSHAQAPWSLSIQADNDAFNFWQEPLERPDAEYSSGVRVTVTAARAPIWGRFVSDYEPCSGGETALQRCLSTTFAIGQKIYTPKYPPFSYAGWRNWRPYAGWLYGSMTARVGNRVSLHSTEIQLGVTGPLSLAEVAQRTAHKIAGYQAVPIGWETQIRNEAGIVLSYQYSRRLLDIGSRHGRVLDVIPAIGASVGNVLTAADVGIRARFGVNLSDPWQPAARGSRKPLELYGLVGARQQAVARNIFLDGNTIDPTRRVERVPGVGSYELGVGLRIGRLATSYQVVRSGREYRTGPSSHTYSSLIAGIEM